MVQRHDTESGTDGKPRCGWASADPLYQKYHDTEWGRPLKDDRALVEHEGSFAKFLWSFVGGKPKKNRPKSLKDVPTKSPESDAMAKALQKAGFKFVGSTICYAFMQASGMVDDHVEGCHRSKPQGSKS